MADVKRATPVPVEYKPTVYRNSTRASRLLTWWSGDKIRFVDGRPRRIGGWRKVLTEAARGVPRSLFHWNALDGSSLMGLGTNLKYYVVRSGALADITPIRKTTNPLGANPIATTSGGGVIVVTDNSHGAQVDDFVTLSGAATVGGLTTGQLNTEHQITAVTSNTWTATTTGTASSTTTGGGAVVVAAYQLTTGLSSAVSGTGWGAGTYGRGTWGSSSSTTVLGAQLRIWSQDNWGEDLVINPRGGGIYYYDKSAATRAADISTLSGAAQTPVVADQILLAGDYKIMLAFGTNPVGTSTADPMHYRWCDIEDLADWDPTVTNAAGGNQFAIGSQFMQAVRMRREIAAFTDKALYIISFVGGEDVFVQNQVSGPTSIVSPRAAAFAGDRLFWMDHGDFHGYSGRIEDLDCTLRDYVYNDINAEQHWKVHTAVNSRFNEIAWYYCSSSSNEIDRYVKYNYKDGGWVPGTLVRLAWADNAGPLSVPRGADSSGYIYDHETGLDDGSTTPPSPITAYIEGSAVELGDGQMQGFLRSIWPDVTFDGSEALSPEVTLTIKLYDKPGEALGSSKTMTALRTATTPVEAVTTKIDIGKRGRLASFRIESDDLGVMWALGLPRILVSTDGRR